MLLAWCEVFGRDAPAIEQFQRQKSRVPLIEVIGANVKAKRMQQADAPDSKDDLLFQPVGVITAIEVMGERAVIRAVLLQVGVEQQDRDSVATSSCT